MNRTIEKLIELYERLPKNADGSIKINRRDGYHVRAGQTQRSLFKKLDVTKVIFSYLHLQLFPTFLKEKCNRFFVPNQNCIL